MLTAVPLFQRPEHTRLSLLPPINIRTSEYQIYTRGQEQVRRAEDPGRAQEMETLCTLEAAVPAAAISGCRLNLWMESLDPSAHPPPQAARCPPLPQPSRRPAVVSVEKWNPDK